MQHRRRKCYSFHYQCVTISRLDRAERISYFSPYISEKFRRLKALSRAYFVDFMIFDLKKDLEENDSLLSLHPASKKAIVL